MKINRIVYDYADQRLTVEHSGITIVFENVLSGSTLLGADPWARGKGRIPPSGEIKGEYIIGTTGWWSHDLITWFYPIGPNPIINRDDPAKIRKDIGIHVNTPDGSKGSAGCIVFPPAVWPTFQHILRVANTYGQDVAPLVVI